MGRFRWGVFIVGLLLVGPLIWVLRRGFDFDPHYIESPLVGRMAPAFDLPKLDGDGRTTLSELGGKPSVVNFWATWCIPCKQEHPMLVAASKAYGEAVNFVGIVYQDDPKTIHGWLDRNGGYAFPILIDEGTSAAIAYGVYGVPESFVLDSSGMIVHKFTGPIDPSQLKAILDSLLQNRAEVAGEVKGSDVAAIVGAPSGPPVTGDELRARTKAIAALLRCPTCQGMSAGESPSDAARAMRGEVERLVAQGYDQEQILLYFEASYGEFIRLDPKAEGFGVAVWAMPAGFLALGAAFAAWRIFRRRPAPAAPIPPAVAAAPPAEDPYLARIRKELDS